MLFRNINRNVQRTFLRIGVYVFVLPPTRFSKNKESLSLNNNMAAPIFLHQLLPSQAQTDLHFKIAKCNTWAVSRGMWNCLHCSLKWFQINCKQLQMPLICPVRHTHPEVSHGVDLHGLLYQGIRGIHEFLASHNASVVDQDGDVSHLPLDLRQGSKLRMLNWFKRMWLIILWLITMSKVKIQHDCGRLIEYWIPWDNMLNYTSSLLWPLQCFPYSTGELCYLTTSSMKILFF